MAMTNTVDDAGAPLSPQAQRQLAQQPSRNLTDAETACWRAQTIDEAKAAARDIVQQEIAALRNYYERDEEGNEGLLVMLLAHTEHALKAKFAQLPPGPMGKLRPVKTYEDVVHYADAVVVHDGSLWQARVDTGKSPPHSDWICLAAAGRNGVDGASPRVRATFDADIVYKKLDIVALNYGAFIARQDDPGACPGDGWQLICSRGRAGERGAPGPRGEKGPQGEAGVSIVGWEIDTQNYQATPRLSDGTIGPPLGLRRLFEQYHEEAAR